MTATPSNRVLVVDDTPENLRLYSLILRDDGCEVVEAASGEEAHGSGIGLATVRRTVTKRGGTIWAESAKNDGATFWFTLGHE